MHYGCLPMYVIDNSENHHKIAMDDLNACKLNPKDREENTPLICNGYYKLPGGDRVLHAMHTESSVHKGICMILTQRGLWVLGMKKQQAL